MNPSAGKVVNGIRMCWNPDCYYAHPPSATQCRKCGWTEKGAPPKRPSSVLGSLIREESRTPMLDRALAQSDPPITPYRSAVQSVDPVIIEIDPIGAPRQTRRDAWKPSPAVVRYRAWKDKFVPACEAAGWVLGPVFRAEFEIAMPKSWSKKKRAEMNGKPHQQKIDVDNAVKAVWDSFGEDDSFVHTVHATKRWAEKGRIILHR